MRKRIVSNYSYPVRYREVSPGLTLIPGENLVDSKLWAQVKAVSARLRAHIATGRVADQGWYVDEFLKAARAGEDVNPDVLEQDEVTQVVKRTRNKALLSRLATKATRGGTRAALLKAAEK